MPRVPYYPQYHGEVTHAGPVSHMPAFFLRDPQTVHWQIRTVPVMAMPRYQSAGKLGAPTSPTAGPRQRARVRHVPRNSGAGVLSAPGSTTGIGGGPSAMSAMHATCGSNRPGGPDL